MSLLNRLHNLRLVLISAIIIFIVIVEADLGRRCLGLRRLLIGIISSLVSVLSSSIVGLVSIIVLLSLTRVVLLFLISHQT
jgi:hypothetical protein